MPSASGTQQGKPPGTAAGRPGSTPPTDPDSGPGSVLAALGYDGQTRVGGGSATYPIIRSRALNLSVVGQFDLFESAVDVNSSGTATRASFDSTRVLRAGADASVRDTLLVFAPSSAITSGQIRLSQGLEAFGATRSGSVDAGRANSDFGFTKVSAEITRNQPLAALTDTVLLSLEATLAGQFSRDVLPLSEKFYLGGTRLGRGFYSGQVTGDNAFGTSIELQFSTSFEAGVLPVLGETRLGTQFYLFDDYGRTWENQSIDPNRQLSSFGAGVRFAIGPSLEVNIEGVHRVTREPNGSGAGVKRRGEEAGFGRVLVRF